jgi:hypothetical protein
MPLERGPKQEGSVGKVCLTRFERRVCARLAGSVESRALRQYPRLARSLSSAKPEEGATAVIAVAPSHVLNLYPASGRHAYALYARAPLPERASYIFIRLTSPEADVI